LGAADYITKPFTPEEITNALRRIMARSQPPPAQEAIPSAAESLRAEEFLFFDETWLQLASDGSALIGAVLPGLRGVAVQEVRLPRIGEVVYQGLPLAALVAAGKPLALLPTPVSGVVGGVNELLLRDPGALLRDPCGSGWIACVCTTRAEEELGRCKPRRVILVNFSPSSADERRQQLAALGCQVQVVANRENLGPALHDADGSLVFLDAASLGAQGPALVAQVNAQAPGVKVVVTAPRGGEGESAYRKQRLFRYAQEPTSETVAEIVDAAFRQQEPQPLRADRPRGPAEPIASITMTNRNGHKVQLLAAAGLLRRNEGLGGLIGRQLLERSMPVTITPGEANLASANLLKAAAACDRLLVLSTKESGQLPGALSRDTKAEVADPAGTSSTKVTMLYVQPDMLGGVGGLDARTTVALADHILREMASY
jgi:glycine cleavage system H protein